MENEINKRREERPGMPGRRLQFKSRSVGGIHCEDAIEQTFENSGVNHVDNREREFEA